MEIISLNGTWQLRGKRQEGTPTDEVFLDATVPGCVQLDLSAAGYLPADLYMGENILATQKYEDYEWWYTTTFTSPVHKENAYLVFEGVDCIAHYYLNGQKIGDSENMFISHEFEAGPYLKDGENTLMVHIESPVVAAHYMDHTIEGYITWSTAPVTTAIRKAAHGYGWDIMPRAVTSGLWREVRLEVRDPIYFSQLYICATTQRCDCLYELACRWGQMQDVEIELEGGCGNSTFSARQKLTTSKAGYIPLHIPDPKLWWPYGYGEANVYDVVARIYQNGALVHEETTSFGIRDVVLDRTDITDGKNGRFRFLVNGVEVMCKGSNWVPLDAFHCRDAQRYDTALALAKDVGCNTLRCWGGNVYEEHKFYDFCDRNGIMVWQDFAMACSLYPQNARFEALICQEAEAVIRKLRNHPSIILWAGDNEVDVMSVEFGIDPSGNRITREFLPRVVRCNDRLRPYLPSSPFVSDAVYRSASLRSCPEDHVWGPRDYFKSSFYKDSPAHFISEIGYHGCPDLESIKKFITPEKVWPYHNNSEWILHSSDQKGCDYRVMLMEKQVRQLFGEVPTTPEDYILASQISQAEAKKYFIERMRVGRPKKSGIIWWNLLDGWPQFSDAVVDYYFTKKLAYRYIQRSQAPFCIIADEIDNWHIKFFACNDTLTAQSGHVTVTDAQSGAVLLDTDFSAAVNASTVIGSIPVYYSDCKMLLIRWEANSRQGQNHYLCGYPPIDLAWYKTMMEETGI